MAAPSITEAPDLEIEEPLAELHPRAFLIGALVGVVIAAYFVGSIELLLMLAFGAAIGAVLFATLAYFGDVVRRARERGPA